MNFKNFGKILVIVALANLVGAVAWAVDCPGISDSQSNGATDGSAVVNTGGNPGGGANGGTCPQGQHLVGTACVAN